MKRNLTALAMLLAWMAPLPATASADKYAITAEEHAACDGDAISLCSNVDRDAYSLIGCMKSNREQLSPMCRTAFTSWMRKRHLPL